jgi:hypothetical protein
MVQRGSGEFEICKDQTLLATGRVSAPKNIREEYVTKLPELDGSGSITVGGDEVYRELEQRGYQYKGLFRGILEARLSSQGEKYLHLSGQNCFILLQKGVVS